MKRHFLRRSFMKYILEFVGCVLVVIGIAGFAVPAEFPMAGFTGIALIINRLWDIPIGWSLIVLNIPVAILCWRLLGRRFFLHSIGCMIVTSLLFDYVAPFFPVYHGEPLLAALACGVIAGAGFALIYMQNASSGGADFIVMAIKAKRPHLSLGRIIIFSDCAVVVMGGLLFQDINGIFYGLIIAFLFSQVIDRLMYGINAGKLLLIVTDDYLPIRETIEETSGRGCTVWQAQGGYQGLPRQVVMCACDRKQMYSVQKAVEARDPRAFTIVLESNEVAGEGFYRLVVGERPKTKK
ncbi:MAG: YitT family protein [Oscillospiraceae bacterium]|nr:YitT family protein [Oscillospiraceae bacterium]